MQSGDQILKQDRMGRVRTPRARREELLDEFERSGVAALNFAQMVGIKYQTFASWVQRRRRERMAEGQWAAGKPLRLVEAVSEAPSAEALASHAGAGVLRVRLGFGAQLEITDEKGALLAARLIGALPNIATGAGRC